MAIKRFRREETGDKENFYELYYLLFLNFLIERFVVISPLLVYLFFFYNESNVWGNKCYNTTIIHVILIWSSITIPKKKLFVLAVFHDEFEQWTYRYFYKMIEIK